MRRVRNSSRGIAGRFLIVALAMCLSIAGQPLLAQNASTGAVVGTVMDASGSVVTGAQVRILNEVTGEQRTVSTNDVGAFVVPLLDRSVRENEGILADNADTIRRDARFLRIN